MALTDDRPTVAPPTTTPSSEPHGFRPTSRRRARIAAGATLAAVAIGGNVLVYSSLDDSTEVLQVVDNIRAGEQITADDLRTVEVDLDETVPTMSSGEIGLAVGRYARTYIASGTLIAPQLVQSAPLVGSGAAVVSIELSPTAVPYGLRERSQVQLIIDQEGAAPLVTTGRVVARPSEETTSSGRTSLSVEVAAADAPRIVTTDDVGVILVEPGLDPATEPATDAPASVDEGGG